MAAVISGKAAYRLHYLLGFAQFEAGFGGSDIDQHAARPGEIDSLEQRAGHGLIRGDARPVDEMSEHREELKSVVVPPGAWAVGRTLIEVRNRGVEVTFTGVRRSGILGREPAGDTVLRDGDIVVIYGQPEELERAEAVLLAG